MASTNKTSNYELSQFIGTDKPAWLSDYNSDMNKIDSGIHSAQTTATGADGKADANTTNIGNLGYLSTTNKTDLVSAINEVDGNADTAQNTASSATAIANEAKAIAEQVKAQFNFTTTDVECTIQNGSFDSNNKTLHIAKNSDGSIAKIYGRLRTTGGYGDIVSGDTGLRPSQDITFAGTSIRVVHNPSTDQAAIYQTYTLKTDGKIYTDMPNMGSSVHDVIFLACVLFITDFGDLPVPQ